MPLVKMPTGEIVDMPDQPTAAQLAELQSLHPDLMSAPGGGQDAAAPQQPSLGQDFLRQLGLTARAGLTGLTGTVGVVGDALNAGINKVAGTHLGKPSEALQTLMTQLGLPEPQNSLERFSQGVASMMAGAGDPAMNALSRAISPAALYEAPTGTVKQQTLANARDAGYKITPGEAQSSMTGRALEAAAGKKPLQAAAAAENQGVTDALLRRAAGLPADAPLTPETLHNAISQTYERGYGPITSLGNIPAMPQYQAALKKVLEEHQGVSRSFPGAAKDDVADLVKQFSVPGFDAQDAVRATRLLRDDATQAFKEGNNTLGHARLAVSRALEDNIENYLSSGDANGTLTGVMKGNTLEGIPARDVLERFRDARRQLAQQYTVRDALIPGLGSGDALQVAAKLRGGAPLTGPLRTIGEFANAAPSLAKLQKEAPHALTGLESYGLAGGAGAALAGGGLGWASVPVGRALLRQGLLTKPGQALFAGAPQVGASGPLLNAMPTALMLGSGLFGQ